MLGNLDRKDDILTSKEQSLEHKEQKVLVIELNTLDAREQHKELEHKSRRPNAVVSSQGEA